ncbi:MFS general substrate transporter [Gloeophyllum trabeum ATCC 11539]|uniref:MFS general substrate transporter n=1 Tax=Gloeophyllum trabeum (strain ATCC 11539 / FP-39264 / Madison 617) TaxID=670483 RepID=S7REU6_GLOTA|nr:MFS general substrate transporter [Gloeophyllum trabeum ATCC 11539]EPQ52775.1 MFS general substrate transporter [Gloeophyllum trabeum ATCC 11539]
MSDALPSGQPLQPGSPIEADIKEHSLPVTSPESADGDGLGHSMKPWEIHLAFASLATGGFLAALDQTITSTSMPTIASEFHSLNEQSWIATSYLITSTVFQPFFGRASDLWGCKATLITAILLFEFGSLMTATAQNYVWLCCARAVAGIGGAGLLVVIMIMISQMVPIRERGRYMGVMYARLALANVLGPVLGGIFTHDVSWRWCFYINLPIGGLAIVIILSLFNKMPDQKKKKVTLADIDFGGIVILSVSVVLLLLALAWGGVIYPWSSRQVIALLVVGGALIPVFVVYEMRVPSTPIIPLTMFRHRNVVMATTNYFFTNMVVYGLAAYIPTYFQLVKGDTQLVSGLELLPYILPLSISSVVVGILIQKTGWVRPWLWAGGIVNLLGSGLCILINQRTPRGPEFAFLIIAGVGMGFVFQTNTVAAQSQAESGELASITTMTMWSKSLGGIVGISVQGSIIQNVLNSHILGNPVSAPYIQASESVTLLRQAPVQVQAIVRMAYGEAFSSMMIATTALVAMGFLSSLFAGPVPLGKKSKRGDNGTRSDDIELGNAAQEKVRAAKTG